MFQIFVIQGACVGERASGCRLKVSALGLKCKGQKTRFFSFFTFCTKTKKELLVFWNIYIISCFSYLVAWENLRRRHATTFETGVLWAAAATFSSSGRPPAEPSLKLRAAALSHSSHSHRIDQVSTNADLPVRLQKQRCHIYI